MADTTLMRVMVVTPVKVCIDGGFCRADEKTTDLTPNRVTLALMCGAQLVAEDRDEATIRVYIPVGQQVALTVELPRTYFIRT